ncbi:hypothetical protein BC936DRAFT_143083 [Jimgerdemannia flammicorona]|uniref:Uncharacterized protein n=1 Tax=Jimgerdemannia flammicorona TaxID=994334 RepID=A0A432ZZV3_9FUNG|nr:hypothetical protein BC936DRAFT_143083 [Jimgerdemannia flammicorona]
MDAAAHAERSTPCDNQYWISGQDEEAAMKKAKAKFPDQKFPLEQGFVFYFIFLFGRTLSTITKAMQSQCKLTT